MKEVFCIIGKRPIKGFSKTRLAKDLGEEKAFQFYEAFLKDFFQSLKKERKERKIYFFGTPKEDKTQKYFQDLFTELDLSNFSFNFQSDLPFFLRIEEAFNKIQSLEGEEVTIHLTGTDIPDFPFKTINEINQGTNKVAIGPDSDGGFYYFKGSNRCSSLFPLIESSESESTVLESLKNVLDQQGVEYISVPEWSDIDTLKDLKKCVKRTSKSLIPHTSKAFSSL